jgi:hypothetical protein
MKSYIGRRRLSSPRVEHVRDSVGATQRLERRTVSEGRSSKTVGAIAGVVVFALTRGGGSPPISPAESGLSAQAWVVPQADVVSFIEEHGGTMPNFVPNGRQPAAVVRVDWTPRDLDPPFRYQVVVLDPSGQDAATLTQTEPAASWISMGWDGRYDDLGTRFPWLAATTVIRRRTARRRPNRSPCRSARTRGARCGSWRDSLPTARSASPGRGIRRSSARSLPVRTSGSGGRRSDAAAGLTVGLSRLLRERQTSP